MGPHFEIVRQHERLGEAFAEVAQHPVVEVRRGWLGAVGACRCPSFSAGEKDLPPRKVLKLTKSCNGKNKWLGGWFRPTNLSPDDKPSLVGESQGAHFIVLEQGEIRQFRGLGAFPLEMLIKINKTAKLMIATGSNMTLRGIKSVNTGKTVHFGEHRDPQSHVKFKKKHKKR